MSGKINTQQRTPEERGFIRWTGAHIGPACQAVRYIERNGFEGYDEVQYLCWRYSGRGADIMYYRPHDADAEAEKKAKAKAAKLKHKKLLADGWVKWNGHGGRMPHELCRDGITTRVEIRLRDGYQVANCIPEGVDWQHDGLRADVFYYRVFSMTDAQGLVSSTPAQHRIRRAALQTFVIPPTFKVRGSDVESALALRNFIQRGVDADVITCHGGGVQRYRAGDSAEIWEHVIAYRENRVINVDRAIQRRSQLVSDAYSAGQVGVDAASGVKWECTGETTTMHGQGTPLGQETTTKAEKDYAAWYEAIAGYDRRAKAGAYETELRKWATTSREMDADTGRTPYIQAAQPQAAQALNPKAAMGASKLQLGLASPLLAAYASLGKLNGMLKYGGANYIGTEVSMMTYIHAILRHISTILMGQDDDPVDEVPHWAAILAGIDIILCARAAGTLVDDRLRWDGQLEDYNEVAQKVKALQELHAGKNPKHYYANEKEGVL